MKSANSSFLADEPDLPEGWTVAKLGEMCTPPQYGWTTSAKKDKSGLRLLRTTDISDGEVDWATVPGCAEEPDEPDKYLLGSGDILISRAGSVGLSYLVGDCPRAVFASYLIRFRPIPPIEPAFVALFLKSPAYWSAVAERASGIAIPNVNASKLKEIDISFPPLAEQSRIVKKVEQLLARVNVARTRLAHLPAILNRFRQAVLAAACSGRLTADWRAQNLGAEPASKLLLDIEKLRSKRAEQNRETKRVRNVRAGFDDDQDETAVRELPESWTWSRVDQIATVCLGGTPSRKKNSYWDGDVAWVSSGEVANCRIATTRERITREGLSDSNAKIYPRGTVLFAMIGEGKTRGQAAILDIDASTNQNVAGLVFDAGSIVPDFVWYWAMSEYERNRAVGRGGAQPALNGEKVRALMLPLPPLAEQTEIVNRVATLFKLAETIERRVTTATIRAEKLTEAVVAKAFRGELVPTEAELARREGRPYEKASILLGRIKQKTESHASRSHGQRRVGLGLQEDRMSKPEKETVTNLYDLLSVSKKPLSPFDLWQASGLDIDLFYATLKKEIKKGRIIETRPNRADRLLRAKAS